MSLLVLLARSRLEKKGRAVRWLRRRHDVLFLVKEIGPISHRRESGRAYRRIKSFALLKEDLKSVS